MKKNIKKITALVLAVSCLTVGSMGVIAYASGNAYENFKTAIVETSKTKNMTSNLAVQMKQNGTIIAQGKSLMQLSNDDSYSISSITVGDTLMDIEQSSTNGTSIIRKDDVYYTSSQKENDRNNEYGFENASPNTIKLMNMVTDLIVGDVKNQFVANGDEITINLTGAQVPELANVAIAAYTEMGGNYDGSRHSDKNNLEFDKSIIGEFPITKNATIGSVNITAKIEDGNITNINTNLVLNGQDKDNKDTSIELTVNGNITEIGTTIPQQINTTDKILIEKRAHDTYEID